MNNVEKFYDKKELLERFEEDEKSHHEHFTEVTSANNQVEVKVEHRISSNLTITQKEYIVSLMKLYISVKQKDMEKEIMVQLALDEAKAANKVIDDLKLKDIVWIKQEVD